MIKETSPTAIYEALYPDQVSLIRKVWAAAYAKGFKDSDRGHEIIDNEIILTDQLKFPLFNDLPKPNSKLLPAFELGKYAYHYWQAKTMLNTRNTKGKYSNIEPAILNLQRPKGWPRRKMAG